MTERHTVAGGWLEFEEPVDALLAHARWYARAGYAVLPCDPLTKTASPTLLGSEWHYTTDFPGTRDEDQLLRWWRAQPLANVALQGGRGFLALDVDAHRHDGHASLAALQAELGEEVPTAPGSVERTPSGGTHLLLRLPDGYHQPKRDGWLPGVDVVGMGQLLVVAPSFREVLVRDGGDARGAEKQVFPYRNAGPGSQPLPLAELPLAPAWLLHHVATAPSWRRQERLAQLALDGSGPATSGLGAYPRLDEYRERGFGIGPVGRDDDAFYVCCVLWERLGPDPAREVEVRDLVEAIWRLTPQDPDPFPLAQALDKVPRTRQRVAARLAARAAERAAAPAPAAPAPPAAAERAAGAGSAGGAGGGPGNPPPPGSGSAGAPGSAPEPEPGPQLASVYDDLARNQLRRVDVTDAGIGRYLVDRYGARLRYVHDEQRWYVWNGCHWERDTPEALRALGLVERAVVDLRDDPAARPVDDDELRAWLRELRGYDRLASRRAALGAAATDLRVQLREDQLDPRGELLTVRNGVVNLRTGELLGFRPADLSTRSCTVKYRPDATSRLLDEFLALFVPDEADQRYLFALLGYCLLGGNPRRLFVILAGGTTSGKSMLMSAVARILGDYGTPVNASLFRGSLDDKPRPDLQRAVPRRLAWAQEASRQWTLHGDQVKRLTGGEGEGLTYRGLYQALVVAPPQFTPLLVTNVMPRMTGVDAAVKRRVRVLRFDQTLPPELEDPAVKERFLADEETLEAVLARLVAGARDVAALVEPPASALLATSAARAGLDNLDEFLGWCREEDLLILDADAPAARCVKSSQLHRLYGYWLRWHGEAEDRKAPLSQTAFSLALKEREGWETARSQGMRWRGLTWGTGLSAALRVELGEAWGE